VRQPAPPLRKTFKGTPAPSRIGRATTVGKSGPEVEKGHVARREIDALWVAVKKLVAEKAA